VHAIPAGIRGIDRGDRTLGALLPCNVIVYENDDGDIVVSAVDPEQLVGIADNDALDSIATEVNERFERVLASVADEFEPASEV